MHTRCHRAVHREVVGEYEYEGYTLRAVEFVLVPAISPLPPSDFGQSRLQPRRG